MTEPETHVIPPPLDIPFRAAPFFSRRLLRLLFGACLGLFIIFITFPGETMQMVTTGIILLLYIGISDIRRRKKGGTPPLRFAGDGIEIPRHIDTYRVLKIPYENILSAVVWVRKLGGTIFVLDTKKRVFAYPIHEFASPNAAAEISSALRERLLLRQEGAAQWESMERRAAAFAHFSSLKPWTTYAVCLVIALVFLAQQRVERTDPFFGLLDMGANAPLLVLKGEWFRLITANLLHANWAHIINNALSVLIIGALVERQLGVQRYLILIFLTGIVSMTVSAAWQLTSGNLMGVGISGVVFGMLGAQAVLNHRYGSQLPGVYRFASRVWWSLLLLNFIFVPLAIPQVDTSAHLGGLASGVLIGWLLCRSQADIMRPPRLGPVTHIILGTLAAVWIAGIVMAAYTLLDPAKRQADHAMLVNAMLTYKHPDPDLDNELAWLVASESQVTRDELADAVKLAQRSVAMLHKKNKDASASTDTLATLYYRQGYLDRAISLEQQILHQDTDTGSQLARFYFANWRAHGVRFVGSHGAAAPQLTLNAPGAPTENLTFNLATPPGSAQHGLHLYALLHQGNRILGLLELQFRPNAAPLNGTRLNVGGTLKKVGGSAGGEKVELTLVEADSSGCCEKMDQTWHAWFYIIDGQFNGLP